MKARTRDPRRRATPRATYRLQLRSGVDLDHASRLAPYLARLGVSHLYLSPILAARSGSPHGYDVVDPAHVDTALGGEPALERLARELKRHGLALLLDIVPNHMAAHPENPYFEDVLLCGQRSAFASWFDIDWGSAPAPGRLILPILGSSLADCLARDEIALEFSPRGPRVRYFEHSLPVAPHTLPGGIAPADFSPTPAGRRRLRRLLAAQPYRLVWWQRDGAALNYRRFFDVSDLIALRADDPRVFDPTHAKLLELVRRGLAQGVRVDHIDGLADPACYLRQLRRGLRQAARGRDSLLVVEKILAHGESLPQSWPVDGTTGYEFLNAVEAILLDPPGVACIECRWERLTGLHGGFEAIARTAKRFALGRLLSSDVRRFTRAFASRENLRSIGITERELRAAVVELIACLPVYRVYPTPRGLARAERSRVEGAFACAEAGGRATPRALAALRRVLLPGTRGSGPERLALSRRFQQVAAPAMAKGVEDTAFYIHTPLLSRNEVGADPAVPLGAAVEEFHASNWERVHSGRRDLLTVTTHDTKRSADVRARLDVLSECPDTWWAAVSRWRRLNQPLRRISADGLDIATELLFYQTLVGIWPSSRRAAIPRRSVLCDLTERLDAYMQKAAREAKRRTSWRRPHAAFERTLSHFVCAALDAARDPSQAFLLDVAQFVRNIQRPGLWNSLARTLITLASPGIPDLYQGDEVWNFSLVDPDNRRPVDFAALGRRLRSVEATLGGSVSERVGFARRLTARPEDPRLKLLVIRAALAARRRNPELFLAGRYEPPRVEGTRAEHLVALLRRARGSTAVVAVPRLTRALTGSEDLPPLGASVWGDTRLVLPASLAGRTFRCAITGRRRTLSHRSSRHWPAAELFGELPVALYLA